MAPGHKGAAISRRLPCAACSGLTPPSPAPRPAHARLPPHARPPPPRAWRAALPAGWLAAHSGQPGRLARAAGHWGAVAPAHGCAPRCPPRCALAAQARAAPAQALPGQAGALAARLRRRSCICEGGAPIGSQVAARRLGGGQTKGPLCAHLHPPHLPPAPQWTTEWRRTRASGGGWRPWATPLLPSTSPARVRRPPGPWAAPERAIASR